MVRLPPPYDSQEVTYDTFFEELNAAIATLNENSNEQLVPTADYIYKGDVKSGSRFANSLKLRLAIRIAYANPVKAQQMAEEAVKPANGGVIRIECGQCNMELLSRLHKILYM